MWLFAFSIAADHPTTLSLRTTAMADHLLCPRLLFLPDPPSASLLSLSSIGDLPCSLFFLCCRSLPTGAAVAESVVLPAESLRSLSPPCFPPMPPVTAHFFCLRTLHSRKHSHGDEHDRDNNRDTSVKEVTKRMMKRIHRTLRSMVLPICFSFLILEKFKNNRVKKEFIASQERKEPPREATLGNINAWLQEDPAPNCDVVAVIFIVVALLCLGDAFPPPSSSYPLPLALAP